MNRNSFLISVAIFVLVYSYSITGIAQSTVIPENEIIQNPQDSIIFRHLAKTFSEKKDLPIGELIILIGKTLEGTPYVAHTLENESDEKMVVNLRELDCTTFAENCLAIARTVKSGNCIFQNFIENLQQIRYRNGIRNHYPSRLHYFSDWLSNNAEKSIIELPATNLGEVFPNHVYFMSTHPDSYQCLKANPAYVAELQELEKNISSKIYYFIPKDKIASVENKLIEGDIAGITTNIKGLDMVHTVLLTRINGRIHILHASSSAMKVVLSDEPLADYLAKNKIQTGIMVGRPIY